LEDKQLLNQAFDVGEVVQKDGEIWVRGRALQDIFVGVNYGTPENSLKSILLLDYIHDKITEYREKAS
jgi:hypothetical protein